jgi:hypothetical protein
MSTSPRIAIVGTGIAGSYAAHRLKRGGYSEAHIDIYEKNPLLGGMTQDFTMKGKTFPISNILLLGSQYPIVMSEMEKQGFKVKPFSITPLPFIDGHRYGYEFPNFFINTVYILGGLMMYLLAWLVSFKFPSYFSQPLGDISQIWRFQVFKQAVLVTVGGTFGGVSGSKQEGSSYIDHKDAYFFMHSLNPIKLGIIGLNFIIPTVYLTPYPLLLRHWLSPFKVMINSEIVTLEPKDNKVILTFKYLSTGAITSVTYDHVIIAGSPWTIAPGIDPSYIQKYNNMAVLLFEGLVKPHAGSSVIPSYINFDRIVDLESNVTHRRKHSQNVPFLMGVPFEGGSNAWDYPTVLKKSGFEVTSSDIKVFKYKLMDSNLNRIKYIHDYNVRNDHVHLIGCEASNGQFIEDVLEHVDEILYDKFGISSEKPGWASNVRLTWNCFLQSLRH